MFGMDLSLYLGFITLEALKAITEKMSTNTLK